MEEQNKSVVYNDAKTWQIGLFALNNTATNIYMFVFMYIAYYATGVAGLLVVAVTSIMTSMRIFDGITDPIIGYVIDKTKTKFGKFRPFMLIGNIILAVATIIMIETTHLLPESLRMVYFIFIYAVYIIGYTFQTASTKSAQTVLTNNPRQRPVFTLFDALYNAVLFIGFSILISMVLEPKFGGFTLELFETLLIIAVPLSFIFTSLSIFALRTKDIPENWGVDPTQQLKFKDYLPVIKGNRPLQMLIVSASTDKLAGSVKMNAVATVIIYAILMGDFALSGTMSLITFPLTIVFTIVGIQYAKKLGIRKAYVVATLLSIVFSILLFLFFVSFDLTTISLSGFNLATLLFIVLLVLVSGSSQVGGNIVIPMIADTVDYETYNSGQYVPGMISTIFSFIDKLVSSLSAVIVGGMVAMIGFTERLPETDDVATPQLFWVGMAFWIGIPILGWVASLIAMKFYDLDGDKMKEIQQTLHERQLALSEEPVVVTEEFEL